MASVAGSGSDGDLPEWWVERNNKQAERLLKVVSRERAGKIQPPSLPHVSGDHPRPQGAFVRFLFQPYVWPEDSETALRASADKLAEEFKLHDDSAMTIRQAVNGVLDGGLWVGEGADAARVAQLEAASIKDYQADIAKVGSDLVSRGADDVARTKRHMLAENQQAHQEAETFLRSRSGQSLAQVAVTLGVHRTAIQAYSTELQGFSTQYTTQFTNHFKEGGPGAPKSVQAGRTADHSPDGSDGAPPTDPTPGSRAPRTSGVAADHSPSGDQIPLAPGGRTVAHSPEDSALPPRHNPLTSLLNGGLPSLPSMPGGGSGGGLPMGPLQGLMGGFGGFPGGMAPPTGLSAPGLQGSPMPSLGMDFGRGLAAGASAAGAVPPVSQAPLAPLAAPIETAPTSAAPAVAPVAASPAAASAPAPTPAPAPAPAPGGLAPYSSVLGPPAGSSAPAVGSAPAASSIPAEAGGGSLPGSGSGAGLMPVAGRRDVVAVRKDDAYSDLEMAKVLVAELAGAAKVADPGLDWAVAVGHNRSGMPTYWVATNDGAAYIPPGVFLRKTMPIAAGHDGDFDGRWFGWVNPGDKAVRAAREFGDTVSAVATSWALPSEYLGEHPVPEVVTGVKPSDVADNAAAELGASRAHRLQTVDAALYADLVAADESAARDYCQGLIRQLVFGIPGEELSPVAQSVAHALIAQRWPTAQEWALLGEEHQDALVQMACQRPGLDGIERPDQTVSYTREFVRCRQLEALLCWEQHGGDLLNVVYAAWVAGIRAPLKGAALR